MVELDTPQRPHYQMVVFDLSVLLQRSPNLFEWGDYLSLSDEDIFMLMAHIADVFPVGITPASDTYAAMIDNIRQIFMTTYENDGLYQTERSVTVIHTDTTKEVEDEILDLAVYIREQLGPDVCFVEYLTHHIHSGTLFLGVEYREGTLPQH